MTLGIMQPYFFPYLGYFSLIKASDQWIVFDPVQFIRHGWIERNRVLKPEEGWQYVAVPLVKHSRDTLIQDVKIRTEPWQERILRQLEHYRKRAPHFKAVVDLMNAAFAIQTDSITRLNAHILHTICAYLNIRFAYSIYSEMNLVHDPVTHPGQWALQISKSLGASVYVNPPGGVGIFDKSEFQAAGIEIRFINNRLRPYDQRRPVFEPGLSIIDAMMFNTVEELNGLINDYEILEAT